MGSVKGRKKDLPKGKKIMENNLKEIKEFINQWKAKAKAYYTQAPIDYRKELNEFYEKDYEYGSYEYRIGKQRLHEKYNQFVRDLANRSPKDREEKINNFIEKEGEAKEKIIIQRVNKAVGTIIEALTLRVGVNGELNGLIKGQNGTCKIETIYAGGYNIQCLHYRVLVK